MLHRARFVYQVCEDPLDPHPIFDARDDAQKKVVNILETT